MEKIFNEEGRELEREINIPLITFFFFTVLQINNQTVLCV